MPDSAWAPITTTIGVVVVAICGVITVMLQTWLAAQQLKANENSKRIEEKVEVIHKATNSLVDKLVESTGKEQRAKGVAEGKAEQKTEQEKQS